MCAVVPGAFRIKRKKIISPPIFSNLRDSSQHERCHRNIYKKKIKDNLGPTRSDLGRIGTRRRKGSCLECVNGRIHSHSGFLLCVKELDSWIGEDLITVNFFLAPAGRLFRPFPCCRLHANDGELPYVCTLQQPTARYPAPLGIAAPISNLRCQSLSDDSEGQATLIPSSTAAPINVTFWGFCWGGFSFVHNLFFPEMCGENARKSGAGVVQPLHSLW